MAATDGLGANDPQAEHDLARRARRGDSAAFDQLVLRFQRPVYRLCRRMLRSPHAEDLAQETFVRAFVHFDRFDRERPLLPWLLAIARRLCLDLLRRERVMVEVDDTPVAVDPAPSPEHQAALREQYRASNGRSPIWTKARERRSSSFTSRRCRTATSRPRWKSRSEP